MSSTAQACQTDFPNSRFHMSPAIEEAVGAFRAGRPVILMDDHQRENEADLIVPAETMTESQMALFIRECSGIVCLCLDEARIRQLELPPMVADNRSRFGTAFTVTIEARAGVTTGVSAKDRLTTIRAAIAAEAHPDDLVHPGHVFPLRAHPQGVLGRRGHTEGSTDLARLAGFQPFAVLCELMNADGTMMRGADIEQFSATHDFPILTIEDLAAYRQAAGC